MDLAAHTPAFLAGFASQCVRSDRLLLYTPSAIHSLESFAHHRLTVVDIACKDTRSGCYSGEERARQSVELKFGDFVDFYQAAHAKRAHWLQDVDDLEFYLCQCPIAVYRPDATCSKAVLPKIMDDFIVPGCLSSTSSQSLSQVNLWMAVHPSRTSLHYDAYRNILMVLHGRKTVLLYPPSESGKLYAYPVHTKSANHSQVDVSSPDFAAHPRFADAKPQRFVVDAGDALFIPEGWWHQVDSDAYTIAVNFWVDGLQKQLTQEPAVTPYHSRVLLQELIKRESDRYLQALCTDAVEEQSQQQKQSHPNSVDDLVQRILQAQCQEEKEQILIAVSGEYEEVQEATISRPADLFQSAQRILAVSHGADWRSLLENASDDFVALLTGFWERAEQQQTTATVPTEEEEEREYGGDTSSKEQSEELLMSVLFSAFPDDGGEQIRSQLLAKKERFEKKMAAQVVLDTFGLSVLQ